MFFIGISYIIAVYGLDKEFVIFGYWKTTAMPIAFYILPITVLFFRKFYHSTIPGSAGRLLTLIGQASYHIFLVQMVYYHFKLGGGLMSMPWYVAIPINIVISVSIGIVFYKLDGQFINAVRTYKYQRKVKVV